MNTTIEDVLKRNGINPDLTTCYQFAKAAAIEWASLQTPPTWTRAEDGLPEAGEIVLCYRESDDRPDCFYMEVGSYSFFKDGIWGCIDGDDWIVTHWMPLPNKPSI